MQRRRMGRLEASAAAAAYLGVGAEAVDVRGRSALRRVGRAGGAGRAAHARVGRHDPRAERELADLLVLAVNYAEEGARGIEA